MAEIEPCSDTCYQEHNDKQFLRQFYQGLEIQTAKFGKKIYVGDVVAVACPKTAGFETRYPPRNGTQYPLEEPWKVGLILALYANVATDDDAGLDDTYEMTVQWLHRYVHLPSSLKNVHSQVKGNNRPELYNSLLIESTDIQSEIPVHRILAPLIVLGEKNEEILANPDHSPMVLNLSCQHRFWGPGKIEKTRGWELLNSTDQGEEAPEILVKAWDNPEFPWYENQDLKMKQRVFYKREAPGKIKHRKSVQKELEEAGQQEHEDDDNAAAEGKKRKSSTSGKSLKSNFKNTKKSKNSNKENNESMPKALSKKVTFSKKKGTAAVSTKAKPKAAKLVTSQSNTRKPTKQSSTSVSSKAAKADRKTSGGGRADKKVAAKSSSTAKKSAVAKSKKRVQGNSGGVPATKPPPSKKARKHDNDNDDNDTVLSTEDKIVPLEPSRRAKGSHLTYFDGIELPLDTLRWDPSLRKQGAKIHSGTWAFHVGDIIAMACTDCTLPPHYLKSQRKKWFPYTLGWCPALVLGIFHDPNLKREEGSHGDFSQYRMKIRYFYRWSDLEEDIQEQLLEKKPTAAAHLQKDTHAVLESYAEDDLDDFPVTAALGKLSVTSCNAETSPFLEPNMPPSVAIQCKYQLCAGKDEESDGSGLDIENGDLTPVPNGWVHYYSPDKKGLEPFLRSKVKFDGIGPSFYTDLIEKRWGVKDDANKNRSSSASQSTASTAASTSSLSTVQNARTNHHSRKQKHAITNLFEEFMGDVADEDEESKNSFHAGQNDDENLKACDQELELGSRIKVPSVPIHYDKSSKRSYFDKLLVTPDYDSMAIKKDISDNSDEPWEVKLGDIVAVHYVDDYRSSGPAYFEPPASDYRHVKREETPNYPFATRVPWGIAEVVCIWSVEDEVKGKTSPSQAFMAKNDVEVEIRWYYRKKEVPGFTGEKSDSITGSDTILEEICETDHVEDVPAPSLLAPISVHPAPARTLPCHFEIGMPVIDFFCRRFFSIIRRSLLPCGGLDGRIPRGKFHSRYIRDDAVLRELLLGNDQNAKEQTSTSAVPGKAEWKEAFSNVIQKLSLTDASKESSESIMIGRDIEQQNILSFLRDAILGGSEETGSSMFVAGPPGTGKTGCIRSAIARLQRDQATGQIPPFRFIALNGMEMRHPFEAYIRLLEAVKGGMKVRKSEEEATAGLEKYFTSTADLSEDEEEDVTVVLLDEIDYLVTQKQTVMYNFFDWPRRSAALFAAEGRGRRLVVIGVSNTLNLPERLQPRVQSRIGKQRCYFKSYNFKEIHSILKAKIDQASPDCAVFDEDAITFAARKTAAISGDVRKAFHICRTAAEMVLNKHLQSHSNSSSAGLGTNNRPPLVRIPDVQRVSREASDSGISKAVAQSTPFEALLVVSLSSLSRSTGRENNGFDIEEIMTKMEAIAGAFGDEQYTPPPRFEETLFMLNRLAEAQIVTIQTPNNASMSFRSSLTGMGGAWPIASLLLDETNLLLALRGTKHNELAQKFLAKPGY